MRIAKYALMAAIGLMAGGTAALAQDATAGANAEMHAKHMAEMHANGMHGRWWENPKVAEELGLSPDQKTKIEAIMQENKLKMIDQHAALEKEQAKLEPLISSDAPDEGSITSQIDRVAQARAEVEKAHARMLLQVRRVLNADQWSKLKEMHHGMGMGAGMGAGMGRGMGPHDGAPPPPPPPQ